MIPSAGQAPQLAETLRSLTEQSIDSDRYEVIVVDNNQDRDASDRLETLVAPFHARFARAHSVGPAAARNEGARIARGEILIFVDDDISVSERFIEEHLDAHRAQRDVVAVGQIDEHNTSAAWFRRYLVDEEVVNRVPDSARLGFRNVYGANLSLRRDDFLGAGGFDERFRRREDEELGFRLVERGLRLQYLTAALGRHRSHLTARAHINRSFANGYYLALLIERHPEVAAVENMQLFSRRLRCAAALAAPLLLIVGAVSYVATPKLLHRGITACVLVQNSRGFATFRRERRRISNS